MVDEFGSDPSFQHGFMNFLQALVEVALPVLANDAGLVENPDTVDDLFRLCSRLVTTYFSSKLLTKKKPCRFLQRCPVLYLSSPIRPTISQCALAAATLNHRDAFSSVMKYFRDLVHIPVDTTLVCKINSIVLNVYDCTFFRRNQIAV